MDNTSKKINKEEFEKSKDKLGEALHLIHVDVKCIKHLLNFNKTNPINEKKYSHIFNYFYRIFYDRIYISIYRCFIDNRKDVMSIKNFLKKSNAIHYWEEIEKHEVYQKIKNTRHDVIGHTNQKLALSDEEASKHYNKNKLTISKIVSFLDLVQRALESVIAENDTPTHFYALGSGKEVGEFKQLTDLAFADRHDEG